MKTQPAAGFKGQVNIPESLTFYDRKRSPLVVNNFQRHLPLQLTPSPPNRSIETLFNANARN
ncbi:unnamed protein product [Ceratitis capitata]|uniref:(Mediterranean fruit fly) hypothetical protein n=1 Tax=Ceratitis capitata TaxID=7213 RepID=A0A811VCY9_CERCA|nr:unnamed protein product [Ceratitis capitata]